MKWVLLAAVVGAAPVAAAAQVPPPCPSHVRVQKSLGGTVDHLGSVAGIAELCRQQRRDGVGDYYMGIWKTDWPGAGQAYPAMRSVVHGGPGTRASFVTRSWPGLQWTDSFDNEGVETVRVGGVAHRALRIAHERDGIEGNTYHSIITVWFDLATGAAIRTNENQISGQSYGPETTWVATAVTPLP